MKEKFKMKKYSASVYKLVFLDGSVKDGIKIVEPIDMSFFKNESYLAVNWEDEELNIADFIKYKAVEIYQGLETFDDLDDEGEMVVFKPYGRFEIAHIVESGIQLGARRIRPRYKLDTIWDKRNVK